MSFRITLNRILGIAFPFALVFSACTGKGRKAPEGFPITNLQDASFHAGGVTEIKSIKVESFTWSDSEGEGTLKRLSPVDAGQAARVIAQKRFQIESLYQEQKNPYPGAVSKEIVCPERFQPVIRQENQAAFDLLRMQTSANSRKISGVCDESAFVWKAVLLEIYCKEARTLFEIEGFLKKSSSENWDTWLAQVSCP